MVNFALVVLYILLPVALYEHCTIYTVLFVCHYITCIHNYRLFAHTMVLVSPAKPDTCTWERLWCQAYIWICRLGIYLVFMNILIHIHIAKLSGLSWNHRRCCSSNHVFCNLIGLHSWLQQNKSVYRLDSRPSSTSTCVRIWLCQTRS